MELIELIDSKLVERSLESVEGLRAETIELKRTFSETRKTWSIMGKQLAASTKTTRELHIGKKSED